jgi:chemotaxis protein MotB
MRARRKVVSSNYGLAEIWPSFTDVTASIALILFILVLLAYLRNLIAVKRIDAYQRQITTSERTLEALSTELARTRANIEDGRARLKISERKLDEQNGVITASHRELDSLRARLSSIALLRVEALEKVKRALEGTIRGTGFPETSGSRSANDSGNSETPLVHIGDNGNIIINERLVFEYNSFAIKPEGRPLLSTLARALEGVLRDQRARDYIDAVVVQGHTDDRGSGTFNRELSAKRASVVLEALFESNRALERDYGAYFASSAYSEFRPLDVSRTEAAYAKNRRIEISIVLKDANVRNVIDTYMQRVELPTAPEPPPTPQ